MKKSTMWIVGLSVLVLASAGAAQAQKGRGRAGMGHSAMCPMHVAGSMIEVVDADDGVTIRVSAKDPATVKKIQEAAAEMAKRHPAATQEKQGSYVCPMKCYAGPRTKDGRCPQCKMALQKQQP